MSRHHPSSRQRDSFTVRVGPGRHEHRIWLTIETRTPVLGLTSCPGDRGAGSAVDRRTDLGVVEVDLRLLKLGLAQHLGLQRLFWQARRQPPIAARPAP